MANDIRRCQRDPAVGRISCCLANPVQAAAHRVGETPRLAGVQRGQCRRSTDVFAIDIDGTVFASEAMRFRLFRIRDGA